MTTLEDPNERAFLYELYSTTEGDTDAQASTYEIGAKLGIEDGQAGTIAENLFIQGFAEMKTLSGGIGITQEGMAALDVKAPPRAGAPVMELGRATVLEETGRENTLEVLSEIKNRITDFKKNYTALETLVIDIKTIETHLLSPAPKTNVIREVLRSLHDNIKAQGADDTAEKLSQLVAS